MSKLRSMPRKKDPQGRFADSIRPNLRLTDDENWQVESARAALHLEKGEYLKACILYCLRHKVDPRK
jgi:hypothetical protein